MTEEKIKKPTIIESLQLLTEAIIEMKKEILTALESRNQQPVPLTPLVMASPEAPLMPSASTDIPIPLSWRDIVNTTLSKEFGIQIEYMKDAPKFMFTIIVPEKYSNMSPANRQMYGSIDMRSRVLDNAVGENGIREWAERVLKNLGPEIQALIVNDRVRSM